MSDSAHMRRALDLAAQGVGRTGDNPSVGCVIVRDGVVIAEARTADSGRPHAEEQAVTQADVRGATAYVTLEPCAKRSAGTASCSDRLIEAGVARVVIAASDPHPFAAGVGVERLRAAGISVELGVLEVEARALLASFLSGFNDIPAYQANAAGRVKAIRDLELLTQRLHAHDRFTPDWRAEAEGLTVVRSEPGIRILSDVGGREWAVFYEGSVVVRVEAELSTGPISNRWSPRDEGENLRAWIDCFSDAQSEIESRLGKQPNYVGYFEDAEFPKEENALFLALWQNGSSRFMLSLSGSEYFGYPNKRFRLSLIASTGDFSPELSRRWRARLIRGD